jgi:DNA-binding NarL/FixJ family response regulator
VPDQVIDIGGLPHQVCVLDFGDAGVDGWIARHVLEEQHVAGTRGTPGAPVGGGVLDLTPREQEVLSLLATGRTNVQLAETLFISERTANRHVSNIFAKLGVHNRTEAARIAIESGLAT